MSERIKRMIAELEGELGVDLAWPITQYLLQAFEEAKKLEAKSIPEVIA